MAPRKSTSAPRASGKDPDAFRSISETAELLGVRNHVLRFWESRFSQLKPMKRAGNRRLYRPEDLELLFGIRQLLHNDAYTIKGVQKILKEEGVENVKAIGKPLVPTAKSADDKAEADTPGLAEIGRLRRAGGSGGGDGLPMLRDAVEFAIVELEVTRAMLVGDEEPSSVRRSAGVS